MTETAHEVLSALALPGVGRRSVVKACQSAIATGSRDFWMYLGKDRQSTEPVASNARRVAEQQLQDAARHSLTVLTFLDQRFPERLRTIDDPPACLFVKGNEQALHTSDAVAVVGTREPSTFAVKTARSTAKFLAASGATIVSGLAKGCDSLAHRGCLEAKGKTVAVMAHGLEKVYPAENKGLANEIIDNGGALVSEYPIGSFVARNQFVERDRLQSGLSDSVLVIETSIDGGTMHTARFARKHERTLASVVHPEQYDSDARIEGNRQIVQEMGGVSVESKAELKFLLLTHSVLTLAHRNTDHFIPGSFVSREEVASVPELDVTDSMMQVCQRAATHPNLPLLSFDLDSILNTEVSDAVRAELLMILARAPLPANCPHIPAYPLPDFKRPALFEADLET